MAAPIHLKGGKVGKKNSNKRSAAKQKPYKSKAVKTRAAAVRGYHGPKTSTKATNIHALNRGTTSLKPRGLMDSAIKYFGQHGAFTFHAAPNGSIAAQPADMVGPTRTLNKKTKKTVVKTPKASGPKVQYTQKRAYKSAGRKPAVLKAARNVK